MKIRKLAIYLLGFIMIFGLSLSPDSPTTAATSGTTVLAQG